MAKLTTLSAGMVSADFIAGINANFAFLNALISDAASITDVTNVMLGSEVSTTINTNFTNLNAFASPSISLPSIAIGTYGSVLNNLFNTFDISLGKNLTGLGYFIEYYFSALHFCTQRDNKVLAFDDVDTLSLSLDCGGTFGITLQIEGIEPRIEYAHIFANGTIMFCCTTHAYYSEDNLTTYHECTYLDQNGSPRSPNGFGGQNEHKPVSIDGQEILCFSCYYGTDKNKVQYTLDGKIVKVFAYSGMTIDGSPVSWRHLHSINFCYIDNSFWFDTGDATGCHWIKCTFNFITETWVITKIASGDNVNWYKTCGLSFIDGYIYFSGEATNPDCLGVWRVLYEHAADPNYFEKLSDVNVNQIEWQSDGISEIVYTSYNPKENVTITIDLVNFYNWPIVKDTTLITLYGFPITYKNSDGWYLFNIWQDSGEIIETAYNGKVMLLKINK